MRTWMRLIPAVLLAIPFTSSAFAADTETDKKIDKLQKDVEQLRKDLDGLKDKVNDNSVRGAKVAEDLQDIKKMLRDMKEQQTVNTRQSGFDPRSIPPGVPMPPTGTIVLENVFSAPATVHINGQAYRVGANQTHVVRDFPVGPFQYFVDVGGRMVEPPHSETLRPEGYRIRIYTRPLF